MNSHDLTSEQARAISERVRQSLGYLHRLKSRMEKRGFPIDDEVYRSAVTAYNALHALSVGVHYLACDGARRQPK